MWTLFSKHTVRSSDMRNRISVCFLDPWKQPHCSWASVNHTWCAYFKMSYWTCMFPFCRAHACHFRSLSLMCIHQTAGHCSCECWFHLHHQFKTVWMIPVWLFLLIEVDRSHYSVQDCVLLLTSFEMCLSRILLCLDGKIMFLWLRNDYSSQFRGCVGETLVLLLTVVSLCVSPQKQTVLRKRCKEKFPYSMTLHRNVRSFGANNQVQGWEKQVFITQPIWQVQREVNRNSENHRWDSSTPYSHPYSGVCGIDVNLKLVCCVSQCLLTEACMKLICVSLYELVKFLWESVHQHFTILFKKTVGRYTNSEILQPTVIKVIVFKIKKKLKFYAFIWLPLVLMIMLY